MVAQSRFDPLSPSRQDRAPRRELTATKAYLISARPPSARHLWIAGAIVAGQLAAFLVTLPLRHVQLARQDAFVPIVNAIVFLNDLITATLLYAQFDITRSRALLALASGYLFAALMLVPHQLTFPGAFAPDGLLGAQVGTTAWLFVFQHVGFLTGAILYAMAASTPELTRGDPRRGAISIAWSVVAVVATALVLTWFAITKASLLPPIMTDWMHKRAPFDPVLSPALIILCLTTIVVFRRPRSSVLELWIQVALSCWVFEVLLMAIVPARFSLVFYVARTMEVLCSSIVLFALIVEAMMLHTRLVLSIEARDQEREGRRAAMDVMLASIAHELRQPLAAIRTNSEAGEQMLSSTRPQLEEVRAICHDIGESSLRASGIIDAVRSWFALSPAEEQTIDVNDLVRQAVAMTRMDLEEYGVLVQLELTAELPPIQGHRGQLMQVLVNGVTNAIESLAEVADRPRELDIRTAMRDAHTISITIEDSGVGIDPRMKGHMFEPFHSTKLGGMGLGLSICQSIVEAHGGTLSLFPRPEHGAVLRIDLPVRSPESPTIGGRPNAGERARPRGGQHATSRES